MKSILLTVCAADGEQWAAGGHTSVRSSPSRSEFLSCTRFSLSRRELIEAVGDRQGHRIRKRTQLTTRFQKSRHFLYVRRRFQKMLFRLRVLGDLAADTITAEVLPRNSKLLANVFSFSFRLQSHGNKPGQMIQKSVKLSAIKRQGLCYFEIVCAGRLVEER